MLYIPNCVQRNSIYSNVCWLNILSVGSHCWTQHGCQSFPCAVIEFKCSKPLKGWSNLNSQVWTTKLKSKRNKSHKYIYIVINSCNLYQRYIYIYICCVFTYFSWITICRYQSILDMIIEWNCPKKLQDKCGQIWMHEI